MINVLNKKKNPNIDGIYIGRPYVLGNPFSHKENSIAEYKVSSRDEAMSKYEIWLNEKLTDVESAECKEFFRLVDLYKTNGELNLVCWCHPLRCHGDVLSKKIQEHSLKQFFNFEE